MKKQTLLSLLPLMFMCIVVMSSCKKKTEPEPAPTAVTDNVDMGTKTDTTINILANDTYKSGVSINVIGGQRSMSNGISTYKFDYGTIVKNSDNTLTYTSKTNTYGTVTISYTVSDDNGSSNGSLIIKRGTDAQIKTAEILNAFVAEGGLLLYSIDGDTSRIYKPTYQSLYIGYSNFSSDHLIIFSGNIMPDLISYTYSIVSDGNILTYANIDNTPVLFTVVDYFTDSAKKLDGSGYMTVKGYSIQYGGHTLIYTTPVQ